MQRTLSLLLSRFRATRVDEHEELRSDSQELMLPGEVEGLDIPPNDPLLAYVHDNPGVIDVDKLQLESPTVARLKAEGYRLTLPLLSQGELIGLLNLGPRMSEQEYSSEDLRLLNTLATQASPALRVAQLAQQQLIEAKELERMEQELKVARVIQETLLPREIPSLPGWNLDVFWQPAREVGGDFYDFIHLPGGRLGILIADVTDKGVPAAMVVATSRSLLRAAAERLEEPGAVLERANELLHPDIPARMFVTCLYLILDPASGVITFANAGHNLPYVRGQGGVREVRATGMPLGLLPSMTYEEAQIQLSPEEVLLLSSDGIVEAHDQDSQMYGFPRLQEKLAQAGAGQDIIAYLLDDLMDFAGEAHEQEDDITLLSITRLSDMSLPDAEEIAILSIPSLPGKEREAALEVTSRISLLGISNERLKKLETAVAEAVMNAMEHGNVYQADRPVEIKVLRTQNSVVVHISDHGEGPDISRVENPDLDAKIAGEQSPRGWGLFLIKNMVDEVNHYQTDGRNTIELIMNLEGSQQNE